VDGQPVVDELGGEDAAEVVGREPRLRERRVPLGRRAQRRASISETVAYPNTERTESTCRWKRKGIGGLYSFSAAS
jgi:hypothetical protein